MSDKQKDLEKEAKNLNLNLTNRRDNRNQAHITEGLRQNNPQQYTEQDRLQAQRFVSEMNKRLNSDARGTKHQRSGSEKLMEESAPNLKKHLTDSHSRTYSDHLQGGNNPPQYLSTVMTNLEKIIDNYTINEHKDIREVGKEFAALQNVLKSLREAEKEYTAIQNTPKMETGQPISPLTDITTDLKKIIDNYTINEHKDIREVGKEFAALQNVLKSLREAEKEDSYSTPIIQNIAQDISDTSEADNNRHLESNNPSEIIKFGEWSITQQEMNERLEKFISIFDHVHNQQIKQEDIDSDIKQLATSGSRTLKKFITLAEKYPVRDRDARGLKDFVSTILLNNGRLPDQEERHAYTFSESERTLITQWIIPFITKGMDSDDRIRISSVFGNRTQRKREQHNISYFNKQKHN